jgi:hypothetical protein
MTKFCYVSVFKERIRKGQKAPDPEPHSTALEGELSPVMPAAASQLQRFKSAVGLALAMVELWPLECPPIPLSKKNAFYFKFH